MNINNLTLKDLSVSIVLIASILGPIIAIIRWYKFRIGDRLCDMEARQQDFEDRLDILSDETRQSFVEFKENDKVIITGLIACLEGLVEKGCNGPVKNGLKELKSYLINKSYYCIITVEEDVYE